MNLLKRLTFLDFRSLALLRFTLGLLTFYDFLRRWPFAEVFYSDAGILRRSVLMAKFHHIWKPTLLFLNGTERYAEILIFIGMMASLFFALFPSCGDGRWPRLGLLVFRLLFDNSCRWPCRSGL